MLLTQTYIISVSDLQCYVVNRVFSLTAIMLWPRETYCVTNNKSAILPPPTLLLTNLHGDV
jgi:hypothetical protein